MIICFILNVMRWKNQKILMAWLTRSAFRMICVRKVIYDLHLIYLFQKSVLMQVMIYF